jgi:hypothetical protein
MALNSTNYARPRLNATTSVGFQPSYVAFEDATDNLVLIDEYATINSAVRLISRTVKSFTYVGDQEITTESFYTYLAQSSSTYNPANLASATTAPFTIANGVLRNTATFYTVDLDAIYTAAGTART